jgi:hypothetical protein
MRTRIYRNMNNYGFLIAQCSSGVGDYPSRASPGIRVSAIATE